MEIIACKSQKNYFANARIIFNYSGRELRKIVSERKQDACVQACFRSRSPVVCGWADGCEAAFY
jgi:hypothetical protein